MKRVVVFLVLSAGFILHGMDDAFKPGGAFTSVYPAVELGHAINVLAARDAKEGTQDEGECSEAAYQLLPDQLTNSEQKIEMADGFVPMAFLPEKRKQSLSDFSPEKISAACVELEADVDYKALKVVWDSGLRDGNSEYNSLERVVAVKLFRLLACKEKRPSRGEYQKFLRCRRLGVVCFILGGLVMFGGPLIVGLAHPRNCL